MVDVTPSSSRGADVERIHILLGAGNDYAAITGDVRVPVIMEGGTGNDLLLSGGSVNVVLGGDGSDTLTGGRGRNILIGGGDSDLLYAGGSHDILIAGATTYDSSASGQADETALRAILAEWTSSRSYNQRVDNLKGIGSGLRLNGGFFLDDQTVLDDHSVDLLIGGSELDWFLKSDRDLISKRRAGERVN